MEAERALLRSLPRQVVDASSAEQRCEPTGPADAVGIAPGASAPEIPPPHGLRYADLILAVEAKMVHSPQRRRPGFEWWQAEEDEQEEEDEDDE